MGIVLRDVNYNGFVKALRDRTIICIGSGQLLLDMCMLWEKSILDRIELVTDSNPKSDTIVINKKVVNLIETSRLQLVDLNNKVILITSMYAF